MSVATAPPSTLAFIGGRGPLVQALADALAPACRVHVPEPDLADPWGDPARHALDRFRTELAGGQALAGARALDASVVCTWPAELVVADAVAIGSATWASHVEWPIACWSSALVGAVQRCADGGSVVVVTELPAALDVAGHLVHVVLGEAMSALARSLALAEGRRGVRVNVVSTQLLSAPERPMGSPPPLPSFPGRAAHEVAGAVRLLLDPASSGITGTVVRADCGRAW